MKLIEWTYYRTEFLASQGLSPTFVRRFWEKVIITEGCWLWTASRHDFGYGQMGTHGHASVPIHAHVASWILHFGPVPEGLCVCHTCDNPPCVRPHHFFLGTKADNLSDMRRKGRGAIGEHHGMAKLTEREAIEIRRRYIRGNRWRPGGNAVALATEFGVSLSAVWAIARGDNWTHINTVDCHKAFFQQDKPLT